MGGIGTRGRLLRRLLRGEKTVVFIFVLYANDFVEARTPS